MRYMYAVIISGFLLLASSTGYAENSGGMLGDVFRKAAADYEENAIQAVKGATSSEGKNVSRYLELSAVYREMASIKRNAAVLADQNRWNDINWDRYHELESQRDRLLGQLDESSGEKHSGGKDGGSGFIDAAKDYESKARQSSEKARDLKGPARHILMELSGIYQQMAGIKYQAASAADIGKNFDWSHYQVLEQRRDELDDQLKKMKHSR